MSDVSVTNGSTPSALATKLVAGAKKKLKATKKAPKAKKVTKGEHSKLVAATWKDKKVRAARSERHAVTAGGKEFKSVREAFESLKLPMGRHIAFRGQLKAAGKLDFVTDTGRKVAFKIVKPKA